jgi:hypothetical protein
VCPVCGKPVVGQPVLAPAVAKLARRLRNVKRWYLLLPPRISPGQLQRDGRWVIGSGGMPSFSHSDGRRPTSLVARTACALP